MSSSGLAALIDHTILKADARRADILRLCDEASLFGFASVCVNGCWVALAARALAGKGPLVCTVVGFPLGAMASASKAAETRQAVADGADEIDMVLNVGAALDGEWDLVEADVAAVVEAAGAAQVKVILETCLLSDEQISSACRAAVAAGAHFVKTSTGFSTGGASLDAVRLMRKTVGPDVGVKASGGIRDRAAAEAMVAAGATRIGTSNGVAIVGAA